jgi:nucleoid-associated protein YgaU
MPTTVGIWRPTTPRPNGGFSPNFTAPTPGQPASAGAPTAPAGGHPKAAIRAENGYTHVLRWAPTGAELGGWGVTWSALDRPGRRPIVARTADGLPSLSFEFLLGDPNHQVDIEQPLAELRHLAESGQRITLVNLSPQEAGPWRIDDLRVEATLRQSGTNRFTRATATLSLVAAVDVVTTTGTAPRFKRTSPKKAYKYKVKKGDTVRSIATKAYGDPYAFPFIVKANKLKTTKLKTGATLTIPKIKV